jgi:hypothetical protein
VKMRRERSEIQFGDRSCCSGLLPLGSATLLKISPACAEHWIKSHQTCEPSCDSPQRVAERLRQCASSGVGGWQQVSERLSVVPSDPPRDQLNVRQRQAGVNGRSRQVPVAKLAPSSAIQPVADDGLEADGRNLRQIDRGNMPRDRQRF